MTTALKIGGLLNIEEVARLAFENNRAYCEAIGDPVDPPWDEAEQWQRETVLEGVRKIADGLVLNPGESHASWLAHKVTEGWEYGPTKDVKAKKHPCMVAFEKLPLEQRVKDYLFVGIVKAAIALPA